MTVIFREVSSLTSVNTDQHNHIFYLNYDFRVTEIPLTNRVRGPYCKLRTEFFSRSLMERHTEINGKKRGSVSYSTDRENEVSKIFLVSLKLIGRAGKLADRTVKYGPLN